MNIAPTKIVVIHDGLIENVDPLLVALGEKFGEDEVTHFLNSNEGLAFVLDNLRQKMVVVLDINFSKGELSGIQVFEDIRRHTSLVYVVLVTASEISKLRHEDLITLINHDAFALESVTNDYQKMVGLVTRAVHLLDIQIASIIEQWIKSSPTDMIQKDFLMFTSGKKYTLEEILPEIRLQTDLGKEIEKGILRIAINLLTRQKEMIDG